MQEISTYTVPVAGGLVRLQQKKRWSRSTCIYIRLGIRETRTFFHSPFAWKYSQELFYRPFTKKLWKNLVNLRFDSTSYLADHCSNRFGYRETEKFRGQCGSDEHVDPANRIVLVYLHLEEHPNPFVRNNNKPIRSFVWSDAHQRDYCQRMLAEYSNF